MDLYLLGENEDLSKWNIAIKYYENENQKVETLIFETLSL